VTTSIGIQFSNGRVNQQNLIEALLGEHNVIEANGISIL
jgi:hypothetical protein